MEDPERDSATDGDVDGLEEDGLELSLGLRPAVIRRQISAPVVLEQDRIGIPSPSARREEQALRRQEARKKREAKRKLKADAVNRSGSGEGPFSREIDGDFSERRRRKVNHNGNGVEGLTYLMMPGLVGSDGVGFRPAAGFTGGFRPNQVAEAKSGSGGGEDSRKRSISSSSPGVSDYQSSSGQGGSSSDGGDHSSHSCPPDLAFPNDPTPMPNTKPHHLEPKSEPQTKRPPNTTHKDTISISRPPKPPTKQTNEALLLSQMPCVSATGTGPNGKTISGFLYRYTKAEVSIVCVCHGTAFTPAGFVEHAGGVAVENPLRHITVVPFAELGQTR